MQLRPSDPSSKEATAMSKRLFKPRDFLGPATESSERLSKESQQQGRAFENVLSMIGDDETLVLERCMKTAEAIRELPVKGQGHELRIEVLTMLGNRITMCLGRSEEHMSELQSHHDLVCR